MSCHYRSTTPAKWIKNNIVFITTSFDNSF